MGNEEVELYGQGAAYQEYALVIKKTGKACLRRYNGSAINNSADFDFVNPLIVDPLWLHGINPVTVMFSDAFALAKYMGGVLIPFRIPIGFTYLKVSLWGGGGTGGGIAGAFGGAGGRLISEIPVTPGEWLFLMVGGPGKAVLNGYDVRAFGLGGRSSAVPNVFVRGGGGMTALFRGDVSRPTAVAIAGGGGGAGNNAGAGGGGGGAADAGGGAGTGDYEQMRGDDADYPAVKSGGGGGYQGGGGYAAVSGVISGKGGTNFIIAGARNTTSDGSARGTRTPPNSGSPYVANAGRGGIDTSGTAVLLDGEGGMAVLELLVS
jgi:hypothetical protein